VSCGALRGVPWGASDLRVTLRNHLSVGRHNRWRSLSVHKWTPGEQKYCVSCLPVIGLYIVLLSILIDYISSWLLATSLLHRRYKNYNRCTSEHRVNKNIVSLVSRWLIFILCCCQYWLIIYHLGYWQHLYSTVGIRITIGAQVNTGWTKILCLLSPGDWSSYCVVVNIDWLYIILVIGNIFTPPSV
jgi:hypothetical protein